MIELNYIRNRLCHPLRLIAQPITKEDADLVGSKLAFVEKTAKQAVGELRDPF